jgi:hypothetical protein
MSNKTNSAVKLPFIAFSEWQRSNKISTSALVARARDVVARIRNARSGHTAEADKFYQTLLSSILLMERMSAQLDAQQFILKGRSVWLTPDLGDSDYKVGPEDVRIGSHLRRCRRQRGLSLARVAEAVGIREFVLASYEAGRQRSPHDVIARLVDLYRATRL